MRLKFTFLFLIVFAAEYCEAGTITLNEKDATVWLPKQIITGSLTGTDTKKVKVYCNNVAYPVSVATDHTFKLTVNLKQGENKIWAGYGQDNTLIRSVNVNFTLGYKPLPFVKPFASIKNGVVILDAVVINNPGNKPLKYFWTAGSSTMSGCKISNATRPNAAAQVPENAGVYNFNLRVTSGRDSARFTTYVVRDKGMLHAFDMAKDHAAWIDSAVIYQITPGNFVKKGNYDDITAKLPELKQLGINTIYLQPVYKTFRGGQGYDVTDYFSLRPDLGTEAQLSNLISVAKKLQFKVLFDFVPNHTSINHPYAQDYIKYGKASHYYSYYQHVNDGKKYSSLYHKDDKGFVAYFWDNLVNLDYNNPEVQQWIIEATKYWLRRYDIDGYRFDAVWGINARNPEFGLRLQAELKSIKPGLLLIAEDKATDKTVFEKGFDAAYDWTADTAWISKWSWQTNHDARKNLTIFNLKDTAKRAALMRKALFGNSNMPKTLRFIENNDVPRFIASQGVKETKAAAALMFALPGIPMLYNGQEIGSTQFPYSRAPIFKQQQSIRSLDSLGMFSFYQKLIQLRMQYPALRQSSMAEVPVSGSGSVIAVHRWEGGQHFIVVINLNNAQVNAQLDLKDQADMPQLSDKTYLQDVLGNDLFTIDNTADINIPLGQYGIMWLLIKQKV